ncbi:hypothetical protein MNBD_CHLOROFLEXI01-4460 [hydrothermal vent metagenome]|uniref:Peptidase M10 metallopeptidase domain-containing protein n=1 Tax=hydrothermal vent metagenome TaxID=652676 RepID=A0A3B0US71_9ZZZZ
MKKGIQLIVVSVALVVTISLIGVKLAHAWVVQNPKWDISSSTTVNYRANQLPTAFQNRLSDARWAWNGVSPARINLYRNDSSYGLRVYDGWIDGAGGYLGVATRYWPWNTYISWATIKVETNESWYTGTGSPGATEIDLQSLLTHELGHGVAILHTNVSCTGTSRPTMCSGQPVGTNYMRSLESDDQGALNYLYP